MKPTVYMMLGLTGSGKTTFARDLREKLLLDVLSLDAEYERQGGKLNNPKWDVAAASRAEEVINAKVREYVQSGESVILDFCFWLREGRMQYREFIKSIGAKCHVYYFELPIEELWKRLESRSDGQVVTREMLDDFVRRFQLPVDEKVELVLAQPHLKAGVEPENIASQKVLISNGFTKASEEDRMIVFEKELMVKIKQASRWRPLGKYEQPYTFN